MATVVGGEEAATDRRPQDFNFFPGRRGHGARKSTTTDQKKQSNAQRYVSPCLQLTKKFPQFWAIFFFQISKTKDVADWSRR